jgi:transcriptional regulator with PAS, ATPase and Fis domain
MAAATAAALVWQQLASGRHIERLETEVARVQTELRNAGEVLVRQESAVETLEEDLEAARAAVARSTAAERDLVRATDALGVELAQARAQEEQTRRRLHSLESELRGLRAVDAHPGPLPDAELDRLRATAERMGIVTSEAAVLAAFRDLEKAGRASLPILLTGEPGTGKELFARAAHRLSPRASRPFVAVNMAAISPDLFESELFGHVRGSFTGAVGDRKGYFEQAEGGTIFLDEIGDLRSEHQGKLLRVLQEKTFYRVGASRPTAVDVRVIAATNRDLERGIAEGWFREDLYFRLKGLVLRLRPLRERPADIPLLAARFVATAAAEIGRRPVTLSHEAARALQQYPWGGNIRELQNALRQAVALAEGPTVTEADLRLAPAGRRAEPAPESDGDEAVLACLRQHRFDMQGAADALGCDRSTVTQRLKGLGFRALVEARGDRARAALAVAGDASLARTVELKLREYHDHLLRSIQGFDSVDVAIAACRRRFKNLPERHFRSLEILVRQHFDRS